MNTYIKKYFIKIFLFILIVTLIIFNILNFNKLTRDFFYVFNENNFHSICCVSSKESGNYNFCDETKLNFNKIIKNADKKFYYLDVNSINFCTNTFKQILDYDYLEFKTYNKTNIKNLLKRFKVNVVFSEQIGDKKIDYLFLPILKKSKNYKNYKINLQIVWQQHECLIGYPMVYTSF